DSRIAKNILYTAAFFQVRQKWRMFTRSPINKQLHLVITLHRRDGGTSEYVDEFPYKPDGIDIYAQKSSYFAWLRYFHRLFSDAGSRYHSALAGYLCRKLNRAEYMPENKLTGVDLSFFNLKTSMKWPDEKDKGRKIEENFTCPASSKKYMIP